MYEKKNKKNVSPVAATKQKIRELVALAAIGERSWMTKTVEQKHNKHITNNPILNMSRDISSVIKPAVLVSVVCTRC